MNFCLAPWVLGGECLGKTSILATLSLLKKTYTRKSVLDNEQIIGNLFSIIRNLQFFHIWSLIILKFFAKVITFIVSVARF